MADQGTQADIAQKRTLIAKVLRDPDLYPDEFKSWLPKYLSQNPNLQLSASQTPRPETLHFVGEAGEPPYNTPFADSFGGTWQPANFYRDTSGIVRLGGAVVMQNPAPQLIFNLPEGYRPNQTLAYPSASANGALSTWQFAVIKIDVNGDVTWEAGDNNFVTLSGIAFRKL